MKDKEIVQIKTREFYHLLLIKDVDIMFVHRLLNEVYYVIWYRHLVQTAETPEAESLARWSLTDARTSLNDTLRSMDICSMDKDLVRYVADNYEFDKR